MINEIIIPEVCLHCPLFGYINIKPFSEDPKTNSVRFGCTAPFWCSEKNIDIPIKSD